MMRHECALDVHFWTVGQDTQITRKSRDVSRNMRGKQDTSQPLRSLSTAAHLRSSGCRGLGWPFAAWQSVLLWNAPCCTQAISSQNGALLTRAPSVLVLVFASQARRLIMGRKGWTVMEVPNGCCKSYGARDRRRRGGQRRRSGRMICQPRATVGFRQTPVRFSSESVSLGRGVEAAQCRRSSRVVVAVDVGVLTPSRSV